jgi:hypothetical protein
MAVIIHQRHSPPPPLFPRILEKLPLPPTKIGKLPLPQGVIFAYLILLFSHRKKEKISRVTVPPEI